MNKYNLHKFFKVYDAIIAKRAITSEGYYMRISRERKFETLIESYDVLKLDLKMLGFMEVE